jgi:hypothetical protein
LARRSDAARPFSKHIRVCKWNSEGSKRGGDSGAKIVFSNIDSGVQRIATTGSAGAYSLGDIPPGSYSARALRDGFAAQEKTGLTLQVNQTATLDFMMTVGSHEETVTVVSNLSGVNSTTSELGTVITTKLVTDLPLNGRKFTQLLA